MFEKLVAGIQSENRLEFEETIFLLLSGRLPNKNELGATRSMIAKTTCPNHKATMNILALQGKKHHEYSCKKCTPFYCYDENPDDISRDNLILQSTNLIAKFPTIITYAYQVLRHDLRGRSLHVRLPKPEKSVSENFLFMMKGPNKYTELDVRILDLL